MTILVLSTILLAVIALWLLLLRVDTSFIIATAIYDSANKLEAKLAGLKHYKGHSKIFDVETNYLSNVARFTNTKPVLVLVHGFSADKYIWNRLAMRLNKDYQLYIPDLLGHGDTAYSPNQNYSTKNQVKLLLEMLDEANIQGFHIIGNSMGGLMAAQLLEICPERIQKSILIDPAGVRSDFSLEMAKTNQNPFNHYNEDDFFYFYDLVMTKPPYIPKFVLRALANKYIGKREQYVHMFRDFFNPDDFYDPQDHKIDSSDTMLIWGVNDKLMPVEDYVIWQSMLDSKTTIYEDLGHMPMVEDVRRVARDIKRFLNT